MKLETFGQLLVVGIALVVLGVFYLDVGAGVWAGLLVLGLGVATVAGAIVFRNRPGGRWPRTEREMTPRLRLLRGLYVSGGAGGTFVLLFMGSDEPPSIATAILVGASIGIGAALAVDLGVRNLR